MSASPHVDQLGFDPAALSASTLNGIRVGLGAIGASALVLGIMLVAWPAATWKVVAVVAAIYFVISGLIHLAMGVFSREVGVGFRLANMVFGLLLLLGGVFALRNSLAAAVMVGLTVAIMVGISWIVEGVLTLVAVGGGKASRWALVTGLLSVVAGIVVLSMPLSSVVLLTVFTGVFLMITGVGAIMQAFTLRKADAVAQAPVDAAV